jgi:hypothetical protein
MKKAIFILVLSSLTSFAQNQTAPSGSISRSRPDNSAGTKDSTATPPATDHSTVTSPSGTGALTFTNRQGQTYSVDQLANNLRILRSTVEETMPMLTAFTETHSNSVNGDKSWTGKLGGIVSGALNRNQNTNNAADQNSGRLNSLVTALQGMLGNNNSSATAPISANTIRDLEKLQTQLQPVASTLQNLNVNIGPGDGTSTNNTPALTPTGKTTPNRPTQPSP